LVVLQTCPVGQSPSATQATQTAPAPPGDAQSPERQTALVPPSPGVHGPSPFRKPQALSVSQTLLTHATAPAATVQVPSSVGLECPGSVGTGLPLATFGVHVCALSLQYWPLAQSASTAQPPAGSHVPLELQAPERHTVAPLAAVQGPPPFA
jgi:hypothetical protein